MGWFPGCAPVFSSIGGVGCSSRCLPGLAIIPADSNSVALVAKRYGKDAGRVISACQRGLRTLPAGQRFCSAGPLPCSFLTRYVLHSAVMALLLAAKRDSPGNACKLIGGGPGVPPVVSHARGTSSCSTSGVLRWITVEDAVLRIERRAIPKAGCIRVSENQLPTVTAIGGPIETGLVSGSARQNQNILRIPGPDPAEVQLACPGNGVHCCQR